MARNFMFWQNHKRRSMRSGARRRQAARFAGSRLNLELLEARIVLNADPVLSVVANQSVAEGSALVISDIGTFTDVVESDGTAGGGTIGLNPLDFTPQALPFDPLANVVIDTTNLTIAGGYTGVGTTITRDVGFGNFEIAVFTFSSFELDAGLTITALGSRPLALLSQGSMTIAGTINASAFSDGINPFENNERAPGPGGGYGGLGSQVNAPQNGSPAAGAPTPSVGQWQGTGGGTGGGFGGAGGVAEISNGGNSSPATVGQPFGDLATAIQGGSGGATAGIGLTGPSGFLAGGGGGGGGVELGAVGTMTVTSTGKVLANGGRGKEDPSLSGGVGGGGGGAGGGVLLHATNVNQFGSLQANGGDSGSASRDGGGGGGGRILIAYSTTGSFSNTGGTQSVAGGLNGPGTGGEDGQIGTVTITAVAPSSSPVIETFDYVIDWGDDSPADSGSATIDMPGMNIGDVVQGSFDGTHTYADDGVYLVSVTVNDSRGGSDTKTFYVNVANVAPTVNAATFQLAENSANGTPVGTVTAGDAGDDELSFGIVGGSGAGAFAIDAASGAITVADETLLDFESSPSLTLEVEVSDGDGGVNSALITIELLNQASINGVVFVDVNANGVYDANEPGIDGVTIRLLDSAGNPVLDGLGQDVVAVTAAGGYFLFEDLDPDTYQLLEVQPSGFQDGAEALGTLGGVILGNDHMQLTLARIDAYDYAFAELGQQVASGEAAGGGFWQNAHGQALITQGGTALAQWLTATFPNVFGNALAGAAGSDVASFFREVLFKQQGKKVARPPKVDAEFMAVALATFFTSRNLAGEVAAAYGFNVTDTGIGTKIVNVGSRGSAFGVANGTDRTILQLLLATDNLTDQPNKIEGFAYIYDTNGDGVIDKSENNLRSAANELYSLINQSGEV